MAMGRFTRKGLNVFLNKFKALENVEKKCNISETLKNDFAWVSIWLYNNCSVAFLKSEKKVGFGTFIPPGCHPII